MSVPHDRGRALSTQTRPSDFHKAARRSYRRRSGSSSTKQPFVSTGIGPRGDVANALKRTVDARRSKKTWATRTSARQLIRCVVALACGTEDARGVYVGVVDVLQDSNGIGRQRPSVAFDAIANSRWDLGVGPLFEPTLMPRRFRTQSNGARTMSLEIRLKLDMQVTVTR